MRLHVRERAELRPSVSFDPPALPSPSKPRIGLTPNSDYGFQVSCLTLKFVAFLVTDYTQGQGGESLPGGTCLVGTP